jgi:hypothetical protein
MSQGIGSPFFGQARKVTKEHMIKDPDQIFADVQDTWFFWAAQCDAVLMPVRCCCNRHHWLLGSASPADALLWVCSYPQPVRRMQYAQSSRPSRPAQGTSKTVSQALHMTK